MSRTWKPVLIVLAIVVSMAVAIHLFGGAGLASLRHAIHGR